MNTIYCIWSGDNKMSNDRKRCFNSIVKNSKCEVRLVTNSNISNYISGEIHKAYNYLSFTHRSDYLRIYLMYHYGGGYTDIKHINFDWNVYFKMLEDSDQYIEFIGYREINHLHIASDDEVTLNNYHKLPGNGQYIFKKHTNIARTILDKMESLMSSKFDILAKNPGTYHPRAVSGGIHGDNIYCGSEYPFTWNELLGKNFHETCYKNIGKFMLGMPYPNFYGYR